MRITKSQLQHIIQEELNGVLSEYSMEDALALWPAKAATWTWGKLTGQDPEDVEAQVERGLQTISRGKPFGGFKAAQRDIVGTRVGPEGERRLKYRDRPKIYDPERWAAGIPNWLERFKGKPSGEEEVAIETKPASDKPAKPQGPRPPKKWQHIRGPLRRG